MPRLTALCPDKIEARTRELLDQASTHVGTISNLMRTIANSEVALEGCLRFSETLHQGELPVSLRQKIALTVAEANNCEYTLAAHTTVAKVSLGMTDEEIARSRTGAATEMSEEAALQFSKRLVERRGWVTDEDLSQLRNAGYGDGDITEIVMNVGLNMMMSYFSHVAQLEFDFPEAAPVRA